MRFSANQLFNKAKELTPDDNGRGHEWLGE